MTGTLALLRHFLRRDRWMILAWSAGITLLYWSQAVSVGGLYATQEELDRAAAAMDGNAAFVAMAGPARALDTVGGQVAWQATAFGAICAGLMSMFLVVRHTRAEEESGRDELLRAAAVGRAAPTAATLVVAVTANVLTGALVAASLVAFPLAVADSVALGVGLAAVGLVFAAVALLAAQLTSGPRAAYGLTGAVIGAAFVLRAIGDVGSPALTWLSPIGWYQAMHAFSGLRWWPLLLLAAAGAVTVVAAVWAFDHRDHGAGVLADRPGPTRAGPRLGTPLGLAWRLQRGTLAAWGLGLLLTGMAYGSLGSDVGDVLGDSAATEEILARGSADLVDGFYATSILMLGLMACGYAVSTALRPRHDEATGVVEVLLATGLSRRRWLVAQTVLTVVGSAVVVTAAGVGLGVGYALTTGDSAATGTYLVASLPYLAPVLVMSALARLLFGLRPRLASLAWLALLFAVVVMLFGELLRMPEWLQDLSPFHHLALVPAEDFRWGPFLALLVVAGALSAAGHLLFGRRDVEVR
ncbi:ABC transporter permease [Nocardioides sp. zg-1228]|uniref:ABC transporter permease n=1 Tax=Nocardioides sp. zg-1228 TaxID=2763008 RepID=UPI00164303D3|nr:ABC transporter permease [Nocardioides sp. zg-1228]MBC2934982.1 ABC transporter permease [Nocardioides sp. zg-1228]QSF56157.1 polyketide antibiotic transporter [Nocardioides sp. zg-1228]